MVDDVIPDDVRDFILRHIDSVAELEALLLLRANREPWDVPRTAARLYASQDQIKDVLTHLSADGLLVKENERFRYETSGEQADIINRLAEVYRRNLIPVTNVIHGKPSRIREFADAFKFRKDT